MNRSKILKALLWLLAVGLCVYTLSQTNKSISIAPDNPESVQRNYQNIELEGWGCAYGLSGTTPQPPPNITFNRSLFGNDLAIVYLHNGDHQFKAIIYPVPKTFEPNHNGFLFSSLC